jgi:Asp-tRNA(Asn)/Glu-tRNA(Gln) amidotransferase A subunit family amidase
MATKLWALGALDLAGRIAAKEISSREVIGAHLARIEAVNPAVNAVTVALADQAMAAAATADQAIAAGRSLGPLHGVPFTVKENLDVEGGATTAGLAAFRDNVAPADAVVVARMRAALKPSRSRVPWWNATDPAGPPLVVQLMAVNGPMARSVADLRAALAVISG